MRKLNAKMLMALRAPERIDVLLLFSRSGKEFTFNEIKRRFKLKGEHRRKILNDLWNGGWLERSGGRPYKYRIAEQSKISKKLFQID